MKNNLLFAWVRRKYKLCRWKYALNRMVAAMRREGWDAEDICTVLLYIGGEITTLTPSVKERMRLWPNQ